MTARYPYLTGFCGVGAHQSCPVVIRQPAGDRATPCTCGCHLGTPAAAVGREAMAAASNPQGRQG